MSSTNSTTLSVNEAAALEAVRKHPGLTPFQLKSVLHLTASNLEPV